MIKFAIIACAIFVILFSFFVNFAGAIPDPSAVYCSNSGYTYDVRKNSEGDQYGVCIFPNGTECSAWAYLCKCTNDKSSCGQTSTNCNFPCKNNTSNNTSKNNTIYSILGLAAAAILILIFVTYRLLNHQRKT